MDYEEVHQRLSALTGRRAEYLPSANQTTTPDQDSYEPHTGQQNTELTTPKLRSPNSVDATATYTNKTENMFDVEKNKSVGIIKKALKTLFYMILVFGLAAGGVFAYNQYINPEAVTASKLGLNLSLNYVPLISTGQKILPESTGNIFSIDADTDMLMYQENYRDAKLTISQRPVTNELAADPKAIETMAKLFGAESYFTTTKGIAYLTGENIDHEQLLILDAGNLAVFIKSNQVLDINTWANYVDGLKTVTI